MTRGYASVISVLDGVKPLYARKNGSGKGWSETVVMKDIPGYQPEIYSNVTEKNLSKITYFIEHPSNWTKVRADMAWLKVLPVVPKEKNNWANVKVKTLVDGVTDSFERAYVIYKYVRDRYTSLGAGSYVPNLPLEMLMEKTKANVAGINLLMAQLLVSAGMQAEPVIMSYRGETPFVLEYPIEAAMNYLIVRCKVGEEVYFLDASQKKAAFGWLHPDLYYGKARVINDSLETLAFYPEYREERSVLYSELVMDETQAVSGDLKWQFGSTLSVAIRNRLGKDSMSKILNKAFKKEDWDKDGNYQLDSLRFVNENDYEVPLQLEGKFNIKPEVKQDMVYLDVFGLIRLYQNPFTAPTRTNAIEFDAAKDIVFVMSLELPGNCEVEELPENAEFSLPGDGGSFSVKVLQQGTTIQVRTSFKLKDCYYLADKYPEVKTFFDQMAKTYSNPIVLKKKSS